VALPADAHVEAEHCQQNLSGRARRGSHQRGLGRPFCQQGAGPLELGVDVAGGQKAEVPDLDETALGST
jgi:hypothetical protein